MVNKNKETMYILLVVMSLIIIASIVVGLFCYNAGHKDGYDDGFYEGVWYENDQIHEYLKTWDYVFVPNSYGQWIQIELVEVKNE
jgi:hypothetical protein